jgi:hypothetical protein
MQRLLLSVGALALMLSFGGSAARADDAVDARCRPVYRPCYEPCRDYCRPVYRPCYEPYRPCYEPYRPVCERPCYDQCRDNCRDNCRYPQYRYNR